MSQRPDWCVTDCYFGPENVDTALASLLEAETRTADAQIAARPSLGLKRLDGEQLTPRALRIELVEYYIERGKQQLRERFFQSGE